MYKLIRSAIFFTLLTIPLIGFAQKTDTVTFFNGDRAICEIQYLQQGKLQIKTVAMGTISVEWRKVAYIASNQTFEIVLSDHTSIYGRIINVDSLRNATLAFGIFNQVVPFTEIVELNPIKNTFWSRINGSLDIGFTYTKGTENIQLNSSGDITHRTTKFGNKLYFNSNLSQNSSTSSEKNDAGYQLTVYHKYRIFNALGLSYQKNTELGIDRRLITTITTGYYPLQTNHNEFTIELGGSANRENSTDGTDSYNLEGLIRLEYDLFFFAQPKIFFNIASETFPSFTIKGRLRSNFSAKLKWEIFNDFTFSVSGWMNFDNKPASETATTLDWGTTTSIGYKF